VEGKTLNLQTLNLINAPDPGNAGVGIGVMEV
jgi:hypothetical protein